MIADALLLELMFVGLILLSFLLINNIFLYKKDIKDLVSLMLVFGIVMSLFEIMWTVFDGDSSLKALTFIGSCGYSVSFVVFIAILNRYLYERIGIKFRRKMLLLHYTLPIAVFTLLCVSTPWTSLVFWVDENGVTQEGIIFQTFFYILLLYYAFSPLLLAIFYLTLGKRKKPAAAEISTSMFVFGVTIPILYLLELWLVGDTYNEYLILSLPTSIALLYLITNMSTHSVLAARAQVEAVETDLRIASKIQADALPPVAPEFANHLDLNLRGSMNTAKEVGGDFYDYFPIDENRICFLIADVSGKGTPAALFMMTAKTMIKDYALTKDSTAEIFTAVNERLCENNDEGMFATAWIGIVDTRTMTLQYTNAGHNYPFFQRRGQPCEIMKEVHGLFLAGMEFTQYRQTEMQLAPGDRLLLYTDGVTEAHDQSNNLYGEERLEKVLERTKESKGEEVLEQIFSDVNEFARGVPQFDDITMIVLSIKDKEVKK